MNTDLKLPFLNLDLDLRPLLMILDLGIIIFNCLDLILGFDLWWEFRSKASICGGFSY